MFGWMDMNRIRHLVPEQKAYFHAASMKSQASSHSGSIHGSAARKPTHSYCTSLPVSVGQHYKVQPASGAFPDQTQDLFQFKYNILTEKRVEEPSINVPHLKFTETPLQEWNFKETYIRGRKLTNKSQYLGFWKARQQRTRTSRTRGTSDRDR